MSFQVVIRQRPPGMAVMLTKVEMSTDGLQLKLIKDIQDVMSINGQAVNTAQKETIRKLGTRWEVTDIEADEQPGSVRVTARREGFVRGWTVDSAGRGAFADGNGHSVPVRRADPLTESTWGA